MKVGLDEILDFLLSKKIMTIPKDIHIRSAFESSCEIRDSITKENNESINYAMTDYYPINFHPILPLIPPFFPRKKL